MKSPLLILSAALAAMTAANAQLLITEINSNGTGGDFWELTNVGPSAVDLSNYKWIDGARTTTGAIVIALGTSIATGESIVFHVTGTAAAFRTAWGIPNSVQVISSGGAPGLGQDDAITLFNAANEEVLYLSYGAGAFTRSNGSGAAGGHAGASAGGVAAVSLVLDPGFDTSTPRYAAAAVGVFGGFAHTTNAATIGSPGVSGIAMVTLVDLSTYVRVGRYSLPEPNLTALPPSTPSSNLLCQEASGVTYNWDTDTLFVVGDGSRSITQVSKTGVLINTMTLALRAGAPQGTDFYDLEGITYIGNNEFVISEERDRQLVKISYTPGVTKSRADAQTVKIGTFLDNIGTEGLSLDPLTGGFIALREKSPIGVFQTTVDFAAGTASNGSPVTENSTNLFDTNLLGMTDVAGVFALSSLPSMSGETQEPNLLVLGQENARIVNIDRSGNIHSTLQIVADPGSTISAPDQQHEGITMDRAGNIYVVNENGGGNINFPELWVYSPSIAANQAPTGIALNNAITSILENTATASPVKIADIVVEDDGLGINEITLTGSDAASFEVVVNSLFLKAGTDLDFETKTSYSITIVVDDTTVGSTPDATLDFTLTVLDQVNETPPAPALIVTEVSAYASSGPVGGDWFEVTNVSENPVNITGWKVDDSSNDFNAARNLVGITTIAAGESVIFIEDPAPPARADIFRSKWFGANPPAGLQIGSYTGSGIGLSTGGDAVNLFTATGTLHSRVDFGASPGNPYPTFDNTLALSNVTLATLSVVGTNGAFVAADIANEIGSPGFSAPGVLRITEVAPWSSGNSPVASDWFEVTNVGARAVSMIGWKVDDSSESPAAAVPLAGIDSIVPGESVIFMETTDLPGKAATFINTWFDGNAPAGLQLGRYSGSGIGLSTGGDAVNLYNTNGIRIAKVEFGTADSAPPYQTFDNAALVEAGAISLLSTLDVNGAFTAARSPETGSPGTIRNPILNALQSLKFALFGNPYISGNNDSGDGDGLGILLEFAFGLNTGANDNVSLVADVNSGILTSRGTPVVFHQATENGVDIRAVFIRRKNPAAAGISYTPQFSADMETWVDGTSLPIVLADDGDYELVSVRYPLFVNNRKAQFFRIAVSEIN